MSRFGKSITVCAFLIYKPIFKSPEESNAYDHNSINFDFSGKTDQSHFKYATKLETNGTFASL